MKTQLLDPAPLILEAAQRMDCDPHDVFWWAWPHCFTSTAGPRYYAIGGHAMTWFQVMAFSTYRPPVSAGMITCAGIWGLWDGQIGGWPYDACHASGVPYNRNPTQVNRKV